METSYSVDDVSRDLEQVKQQFSKAVVGQDMTLRKILIAMLCKGHVLLEGVPGIAKTLTVKTIAKLSGCSFSRVQFTPDLLPGDITGVETYDEIKKFYVLKGPIFAHFILADEINRASPKVQSALLEAMQERQVTIGKETFELPNPFVVVATQNPIENIGVYNLPEAQVDRFLFKLKVTYPTVAEEEEVLTQNMSTSDFDSFGIAAVLDAEKILALQRYVKEIHSNEQVRKYIIALIDATRKPEAYGIESGKYIEFGASPRASIGLYIASKAFAMLANRHFVTPHDVKEITADVLRHRLFLKYEAQVDNVTSDDIISEILRKIPLP